MICQFDLNLISSTRSQLILTPGPEKGCVNELVGGTAYPEGTVAEASLEGELCVTPSVSTAVT